MKFMFSDESRICIGPGDGASTFLWRRKGEEYGKYCIHVKLKFSTSIMMWGCMCGQDTGA